MRPVHAGRLAPLQRHASRRGRMGADYSTAAGSGPRPGTVPFSLDSACSERSLSPLGHIAHFRFTTDRKNRVDVEYIDIYAVIARSADNGGVTEHCSPYNIAPRGCGPTSQHGWCKRGTLSRYNPAFNPGATFVEHEPEPRFHPFRPAHHRPRARRGDSLLARIGDDFVKACELLLAGKGRVVVGMGKSGHIGKKIAATLASTGTPPSSCIRPRPAMATWA